MKKLLLITLLALGAGQAAASEYAKCLANNAAGAKWGLAQVDCRALIGHPVGGLIPVTPIGQPVNPSNPGFGHTGHPAGGLIPVNPIGQPVNPSNPGFGNTGHVINNCFQTSTGLICTE